jgi:hypothetical protein
VSVGTTGVVGGNAVLTTGVAGGNVVLTTGIAVGVADPQADATSVSTRRAENMILFFIIILLERVARRSLASQIVLHSNHSLLSLILS